MRGGVFQCSIVTLWGSTETSTYCFLAPGEEKDKQKSRIINLMKRQLRVPLLDMDNTLEEFKVGGLFFL